MILVSTTTASYKMSTDRGYWSSWFDNAEAVMASVDDEVLYYAALEVDGRGLGPFREFIIRMEEIGGVVETWSYDDGAKVMETGNRLVRICTGQNFGTHYAMNRRDCTHVLFAATDVIMPDDTLPRLLELEWPITGLNCPTYCLDGYRPDEFEPYLLAPADHAKAREAQYKVAANGWDVRVHMQSAALLLVERQIFTKLRWRVDWDANMTDDPCYHADAQRLGWETLVRHDVQAGHYPTAVGPMEGRHTAEQRAYVR